MSQRARPAYEFDDLPLPAVEAGTNLLVTGPIMDGARALGLRMLTGGDDGSLLLTTTTPGGALLGDFRAVRDDVRMDRVGVIDCQTSSVDHEDLPCRSEGVASPSDLTGIGMCFSSLYERLYDDGIERIRTGLFSLSPLLMYEDPQTVFRFVHTLTGRIASVDGLGVVVADPEALDERTLSTVARLCDAKVEVRNGPRPELRTRGLPDGPTEWTAFDVGR